MSSNGPILHIYIFLVSLLILCSLFVSVITSSSTREYSVTEPERDGVSPVYTVPYQWRQTITFDECIHDDSLHSVPATQQLSVDSVFVLYNRDEQILRYAMSNSIGPISSMFIDNNLVLYPLYPLRLVRSLYF